MSTYAISQTLPRVAQNLYGAQQIREHEEAAARAIDLSLYELMEAAGAAVFELMQQQYKSAQQILVLCGKGNNGGDGFVIARLAKQAGFEVNLCLLGDKHALSDDSQQAMQKWLDAGGFIDHALPTSLHNFDLIVDALLGNGLKGDVREPYLSAINLVNHSNKAVISVDVPSGLDCDSGKILGCAIKADSTVTFIGLKAGLLTGNGKNQVGKLHLATLGIEHSINELTKSHGRLCRLQDCAKPAKRLPNSHKGQFGHLLCIGGNSGMPGAMLLCARAAMRSGCAMLKVATHSDSFLAINSNLAEAMLAATPIKPEQFEWCSAIALGPGLAQNDWAQQQYSLAMHAIINQQIAAVIDADALNLLAKNSHPLHANCVITPHPGEAARLLNCTTADIENNRIQAARELANKFNCQVILKGAGSVIIADQQLYICADGNPGMATAGMGDTLTGIVGAMLAQGKNAGEAALEGCLLHAQAGDMAAHKEGEHGMLASDLIPFIRQLVNR
ncbi:NAD(P)H-hydrate dehydratase [Neptunicella marina]|uniref:Bifunctional NAD(P)H-hydrate repair enzyme n=1 Tax=Neptunicella marina TaxID=2125989 RepID=A0A8J6LXS4_9ALTE|nr:NAD(P)H-hydrate dehydratase [Neptunicella marina]MBC3765834.1 NAD(P)H-hydrate dehydratase [Neptunicella marina]